MKFNKFGAVFMISVLIIVAYLFLLVIMPIMTDMALTANTTMNASSNMSLYPGTSGFLLSIPWIVFFVPGVIGIALIVVILRMPTA